MALYQYSIATTWNGDAIHSHEPVQLALSPSPDARHVILQVSAPLFNSPHPPRAAIGKPCPQLWDYEVVEIFFLGDEEQYLEVELCPHGQHLVLLLKGRRNIIKDGLDLDFTARKDGSSWTGHAKIPLEYFPPNVAMMNAYAIHGSGEARQYEALYPATHDFEEPDFHRLQFFKPFQLNAMFQDLFAEHGQSNEWSVLGN